MIDLTNKLDQTKTSISVPYTQPFNLEDEYKALATVHDLFRYFKSRNPHSIAAQNMLDTLNTLCPDLAETLLTRGRTTPEWCLQYLKPDGQNNVKAINQVIRSMKGQDIHAIQDKVHEVCRQQAKAMGKPQQ